MRDIQGAVRRGLMDRQVIGDRRDSLVLLNGFREVTNQPTAPSSEAS